MAGSVWLIFKMVCGDGSLRVAIDWLASPYTISM